MRIAAPLLRPFLASLALLATPAIASASDTTPPVIKHTPIVKLTRGENLTVTAQMKDESAIFGATLWYRAPGTLVYSSKEMIRKGEDVWGAQIPTTTDVEYYIEAYDEFGNGPSWAGAPKTPFAVKVVDAAPVFEANKGAVEEAPVDKTVHSFKQDTKSDIDLDDLSLPSTNTKKVTINDEDLSEPSRPRNRGDITPFGGEKPVVDQGPVYKQWWFIGGASVIGVAAITTAIILLQPQPVERNVFGTGLRTQ